MAPRWCVWTRLPALVALVAAVSHCAAGTALLQNQLLPHDPPTSMPVCLAAPRFQTDACHRNETPTSTAHAYQPHEAHALWEVKTAPGKGRGVFAVVDIPKGTRLLMESPLFAVAPPPLVPGVGYSLADMQPAVESAFARLRRDQQDEFLACHEVVLPGEGEHGEAGGKADRGRRLMRILRSNAYTMQDGRIGIYPKVALINHDCQPNVINIDSRSSGPAGDGHRIIVATRDIAAGDEVLTTYIPLLADTATRQARLSQYDFHCGCAACRLGEMHQGHSTDDAQRAAMGRTLAHLDAVLGGWQASEEAKRKPGRQGNQQDKQHQAKTTSLLELTRSAVAVAEYVEAQGFADYYVHTSRLAVEFATRAKLVGVAAHWADKNWQHRQLVREAV